MQVRLSVSDSIIVMMVETAAENHPYIGIDDLGGHTWFAAPIDRDWEPKEFGMPELTDAVERLSDELPEVIAHMITDNWDAADSCALVEYALFGEIIYAW